MEDRRHRAHEAAGRVMADKAAETKPRLRGWIHTGAVPLVLAASAVLIVLSPTATARWGSSVYAASALLLFGVSAIYHRGTWEPRVWAFWRCCDHANIYVLIPGTYTPFALLYLDGAARVWLLGIVWGVALVGLALRVSLVSAPRWLFIPLYVALGSGRDALRPSVPRRRRPVPYARAHRERPSASSPPAACSTRSGRSSTPTAANPSPEWFGFHEVVRGDPPRARRWRSRPRGASRCRSPPYSV